MRYLSVNELLIPVVLARGVAGGWKFTIRFYFERNAVIINYVQPYEGLPVVWLDCKGGGIKSPVISIHKKYK